ncbi:M protein, serotype 24 precursor, putative [Perkinsus marinus ATCC 50983]|uniref:M protein, serotype 24, putative n=1 Tax=Perkinsus marinus (strain ATCC 50983 / TXsc) TaxID=423536 RepID=C5K4Q3_PERM5|nr:M protein, serotype 24 precursor, putative [Perkinsus marinus ATCC 50983]EER20325.1 M protein, serotype 24 precursor, putative [Perkinsus marinus ATCC 50983]|eukprot:XP_002788529.1 M protein, serotype 24 precursor, putative [Perkinsus marinus ATCC 50983]
MSVVEEDDNAEHNISRISTSLSPALFVDLQQKIKTLERKLASREKDLTSRNDKTHGPNRARLLTGTRAALQKTEADLKEYWKEAQLRKREVQALETKLEEMRKERDLALAENRRIVNDRKFLVCLPGPPERSAICLLGVVELQRQQEAMSRAKVEEEKLEKEREIDAAKNKSRMLASTQSSLTSQIAIERERRWKLKKAVRDKLKRVEAKETFMKSVLDDHSMTAEAWEDKLAQERDRTEEALKQLERANALASRLEEALIGKQSAKDQMQYQLRELQNSNKQLREQLEKTSRKLFLVETDKKETAKLWRMMHLAQIDANTAAKSAHWEKGSARTEEDANS